MGEKPKGQDKVKWAGSTPVYFLGGMVHTAKTHYFCSHGTSAQTSFIVLFALSPGYQLLPINANLVFTKVLLHCSNLPKLTDNCSRTEAIQIAIQIHPRNQELLPGSLYCHSLFIFTLNLTSNMTQ